MKQNYWPAYYMITCILFVMLLSLITLIYDRRVDMAIDAAIEIKNQRDACYELILGSE